MKHVLLLLVLVAALVSAAVGGVFADWTDADLGAYSFEADVWQVDRTGTIGFWNGPGALNFVEGDVSVIEGWLGLIDGSSSWLGPTTYTVMEFWLAYQGDSSNMEFKFLGQYLAQRLNLASGRQSPGSLHNVTGYDPGNYLGLADPFNATGGEIVGAIELKYGSALSDPEFEIMKDVCDALNNLWI